MRRFRRALVPLLRLVVLVLVASVGSAGALPVLVQIAAGSAHVCHCSAKTHECLCAKCHPDDPSLALTEDSLKGTCGDDQRLLSPSTFKALITAAPSVACATHVELLVLAVERVDGRLRAPPPTPPPLRA